MDLSVFPPRWLERAPPSSCAVTVFVEGFDTYGPPAGPVTPNIDSIILQRWNTLVGTGLYVGNSLNGVAGYSLGVEGFSNSFLSKTLPGNYSPIIGGIRFNTEALVNTYVFRLQFLNNGSTAFWIQLNPSSGNFSIYTGDGTLIATSGASVTASTTHFLEWEVTIGSSAAYNVYLDGASIMSGTGNTGHGNSTVNVLQLATETNTLFDDLYIFDSTGATNNAPLLTGPVVVTQFPVADTQTQWANNGNVLIPPGIAQTAIATLTLTSTLPGANELVLIRCQADIAATLESIKTVNQTTNAGANFKPVVYSDSAGAPNTLLRSGPQVTGTTAGATLALPLSAGVSLGSGTFYWVGYITDTNVSVNHYDDTTNLGLQLTNTYSAGAPAVISATPITGEPSWLIWGACTGSAANWPSVNGNPMPGSGSGGNDAEIQSSTSGNQDLYGFGGLPSVIETIYTVDIQVNANGISGAPSIGCAVLSGGTTGYGSLGSGGGAPPNGSFGTVDSYFDTDPHTGSAWTVTAVNTSAGGPKLI